MNGEKIMGDYERICAGLQQGNVIEPASDEKIAGNFVMGDGLPQGENTVTTNLYVGDTPWQYMLPPSPYAVPTYISIDSSLTEHQIRHIVEGAVQQALYPGGTIDGHEHRRVEMVEESGKRWRGVLYRVDENATDPMVPAVREAVPTGICWACKRPGESLAMAWYGTHLIHNTQECRELAGRTMEQREHRG